MSEEFCSHNSLLLGKVVVLGSAVVVHTSLTGNVFHLEMLSRQSEFRLSFPYREMLVFRTFGRLSTDKHENVGEIQLAVQEQ